MFDVLGLVSFALIAVVSWGVALTSGPKDIEKPVPFGYWCGFFSAFFTIVAIWSAWRLLERAWS
jgi:hypothetical protein